MKRAQIQYQVGLHGFKKIMLCVLADEIHSNDEENVKSVKKNESEKKVYKQFRHKTMTVCVICIGYIRF